MSIPFIMHHLVIAEYLMNFEPKKNVCRQRCCIVATVFPKYFNFSYHFVRYGHFYDYFEGLIDSQYLGVMVILIYLLFNKYGRQHSRPAHIQIFCMQFHNFMSLRF